MTSLKTKSPDESCQMQDKSDWRHLSCNNISSLHFLYKHNVKLLLGGNIQRCIADTVLYFDII